MPNPNKGGNTFNPFFRITPKSIEKGIKILKGKE